MRFSGRVFVECFNTGGIVERFKAKKNRDVKDRYRKKARGEEKERGGREGGGGLKARETKFKKREQGDLAVLLANPF